MLAGIDLQVGEGKDPMRVKSELKGRWLGADCGDEAEDTDDDGDAADQDEDETDPG